MEAKDGSKGSSFSANGVRSQALGLAVEPDLEPWGSPDTSTFLGNGNAALDISVVPPAEGPAFSPRDVPICVRLLGPFEVRAYGEPILDQHHGMAAQLLCRLSLAGGRIVPKEALQEALWPDADSHTAGQSLNSAIYTLRRALAGPLNGAAPIISEGGGYRLNLEDGVRVDVLRFRSLCESASRLTSAGDEQSASQCRAKAVALYRGDLCEADSDPELYLEKERFLTAYLEALLWLGDYYLARDDFHRCLAAGFKLLAKDTYEEAGHRLLMRCYARSGRRSFALRHYRFCRDVLQKGYGAEPEEETVALYQKLVRGEPIT